MSNDKTTNQSKGGNKKRSFLKKLPSNIPFAPILRRPDYQLRQVKLRFPRKIPTAIIITIILTGVFFVYIGGFYYLTEDTVYSTYPDPITNEPSFTWKNTLRDQTTFEGVTAGILMFTGASGFFLMHFSTQYAYSPNLATKLMLIGLVIALLSLAGLARLFYIKVYSVRDILEARNN
ncbi:MAG: hypothetical protein FK731_03090 [Asgard group archaeon]|nr:hypothetical protein [Asgard group archaeon]